MEDDLKKNEKMEDDLRNKNKNGRRPQKYGRQPNEDDLKKNLFSIPLKFRGKPFLGLAQLSKICIIIINHKILIYYFLVNHAHSPSLFIHHQHFLELINVEVLHKCIDI